MDFLKPYLSKSWYEAQGKKPHSRSSPFETSQCHFITQITVAYTPDKLLSFSLKTVVLAQDKLKEITLKSTCEIQNSGISNKNRKGTSHKLAS